ncbi:MAG: FAD-dependent oxidoreductase [Deltaproteobacteria bacterium]|nr:FAD-dependent oxidoreductase [Deltaproteobacteria bacterium]
MSRKTYKILEPINIGPITLRNRIVFAPTGSWYAPPDGYCNQRLIDHYTRLAKGGLGLIIGEFLRVNDVDSAYAANMAILNNRYIYGYAELAESVQNEGAGMVFQIGHAGGNTRPDQINGLTPIAPSPFINIDGVVTREMTLEDINRVQEDFVATAGRLQIAGFDGIEIHAAHGYLLSEFLSPRYNQRKDDYGGSVENRARMIVEVYDRIRASCGPDFVIGVRVNVNENFPGHSDGLTMEDVVAFAKIMEARGIDYISCTGADIINQKASVPTMYMQRGFNVANTEIVKKAVRVPVIVAAGMNVELGEKVLRGGQADLIAMARGLIADPDLPLKVMEGRIEDIRPCIRGGIGCASRARFNRTLKCELNPAIGVERLEILAITPAFTPRKVLVIGGGPGGMEAARLSAHRGHKVTLLEKTQELGGLLLQASVPDFKEDLRPLITWQKTQLKKENVEVRLGIEATPEIVKKEKPDVLIVAVGSEYRLPPDLVKDKANILMPDDVLLGKKQVGEKVVVTGGGSIGCDTALYIAEAFKKDVTILTRQDSVMKDYDEILTVISITERLANDGVKVKTGVTIKGFSGGRVYCTDRVGITWQLEADTVVVSGGLTPLSDVAARFENLAPRVYNVGDCVKVGRIWDAFHSAWRAVADF